MRKNLDQTNPEYAVKDIESSSYHVLGNRGAFRTLSNIQDTTFCKNGFKVFQLLSYFTKSTIFGVWICSDYASASHKSSIYVIKRMSDSLSLNQQFLFEYSFCYILSQRSKLEVYNLEALRKTVVRVIDFLLLTPPTLIEDDEEILT